MRMQGVTGVRLVALNLGVVVLRQA